MSLRFAILGTGRIAGDYLRALEDVPQLDLIAVVDARPELARSVGERSGVPHFTSCAELFDAHDVEAVLVAVPPDLHEEVTVLALENGAHVLCEKPFALDLASAQRMFEAADSADRHLTMSAKFRHVPDVIEAKARIEAGSIGSVLMLRQSFFGVVPMKERWNSAPDQSGGGVWIDNGTHSVDLLRYLCGPVSWIQSFAVPQAQELQVEDSARAVLGFASGATALVDLSWSIVGSSPYYLECYGSTGSLHLGWKESVFRQLDGRTSVFGVGYDKRVALARQLEHFALSAVRGGVSPAMSRDDVLASVDCIERGYESLRLAARVDLGAAL